MDSSTPFRPFIPGNAVLRELTVRSVVLGTLLGMVFGMSSLYLVLKVGLTVSASIPVAVISVTLSSASRRAVATFAPPCRASPRRAVHRAP